MARTSIVSEDAVDEIEGRFVEHERNKQKHETMNHTRPFKKTTVMVPNETYDWLVKMAQAEKSSYQALAQEAFGDFLRKKGGPKFFPPGWSGWTPKEEGRR